MAQSERDSLDDFMKTSEAGLEYIRAGIDQRRAETNTAKSCCGHCRKVETEKKPLRACTRCLAVRYCGEQHQLAHYSTHKHDCKSFKDPPLCRAFNTKTKPPGCAYPEIPIFAKDHKNGMGIFVSTSESVDCTLAVHPGNARPSTMSDADVIAMLPAFADGKYLNLKVLIQNRRTGKGNAGPIVVVGKRIIAITTPRGTPLIGEGLLPDDATVMFNDPVPIYGKAQVLGLIPTTAELTHFNGKPVKDGAKHPSIQDSASCTFALSPGNYAILNLQYRCGGPSITRSFEALESLNRIMMPCVPHDPAHPYTGLYDNFLVDADDKDTLFEVNAHMDQDAVAAWYKDYKTDGVDKYISSHFGEARAKMITAGNQQMEEVMTMVMGMIGSQSH